MEILEGIQVSDSVTTLAILEPDGSVKWYVNVDGQWELDRVQPISATAAHSHSGVTASYDNKPKISKITVVNGIITELEVE